VLARVALREHEVAGSTFADHMLGVPICSPHALHHLNHRPPRTGGTVFASPYGGPRLLYPRCSIPHELEGLWLDRGKWFTYRRPPLPGDRLLNAVKACDGLVAAVDLEAGAMTVRERGLYDADFGKEVTVPIGPPWRFLDRSR
jgi:hypothetical protein